MAVGAQLRLVVLGGDAKHVVAGDADAVDNLLRLGCRFGFGFLFLSHNRILAHRRELGGAGIGARAVSAWCGKGDGGKNKAHRKGLVARPENGRGRALTPAESVAQPLLAVHGCSIQNKAHRQECLCYWRRRMVGAAKAMTAVSTNAKPLESAMATGVLQRSANAPTSRLPSGVKPR